ncbi:D-alanyl-D-alanine carboxypeptidase family protein [Oceanospirillum beijerinckii]|uniref:D-alanyl-D-alanine carboxypeptidase family protein n=1 Tax=Oceanospirillum beijerinckii TaxID=64976 RepID=UPI0003FEF1FC|nr:D-alanyl-D-alanine carboxypeptidase family protein [Oceanospirillum beijerinckii]MAC45315.1 peptidase M15 [Oceanospirillum sp.]
MDRRSILKAFSISGFVALGSGSVMRQLLLGEQQKAIVTADPSQIPVAANAPKVPEKLVEIVEEHAAASDYLEVSAPQKLEQQVADLKAEIEAAENDPHVKDYMQKIRYFEGVFEDDFFVSEQEFKLIQSTLKHLGRVQRTIGHGNFNLINFDQMIKYGRNFSQVGEFTKTELDFLEQLFFVDAGKYGFYGEKVLPGLTDKIPSRELVKVPKTGHYLFKGKSLKLYDTLRKDVGEDIFLTSGIRSTVKQMYLFLSKAVQAEGNMSKASRSLAPPGYSYHAVGDFDVGKVGYGYKNFTEDFAQSDVYKRLQDLGYINIRYTNDNRFGVRYEPWHIQVV